MAALAVALVLAVPIHVQGHSAIGPYRVHGGTLAAAVRAFGAPLSRAEARGACSVRWRGLTMRFYTLVENRQCGSASSFESATVTGAWTADRGLRRGDTLARLRRLFPHASPASTLGRGALWLVRASSPAIGDYGLAVVIRSGRTADLLVLDPQGGE